MTPQTEMGEMPRKTDEVVMAIFKIYSNLYFYIIPTPF